MTSLVRKWISNQSSCSFGYLSILPLSFSLVNISLLQFPFISGIRRQVAIGHISVARGFYCMLGLVLFTSTINGTCPVDLLIYHAAICFRVLLKCCNFSFFNTFILIPFSSACIFQYLRSNNEYEMFLIIPNRNIFSLYHNTVLILNIFEKQF